MRLLLDTSTLLWWLDDNARLGPASRSAIADADTEVFVSAASAWEISVKRASGKLDAPFDVADALARNHFLPLAIEVEHALAAGDLPRHHRDPFDRMLVAQAHIEQLTLVTSDAALQPYGVTLLDAEA